jgi:DNA-binding transcriptional MerR regulator
MTRNELAQRFNLSPRTIKKYRQLGLLPAPLGRGPAARWDPACIPILEEMRTLKEDLAPLRDLAERLHLTGTIRLPSR